MTTFLSNRDIYTSVVCGIVPQATERLWIATADIKDMYVDAGGRDMVPFLEVLDGMVKRVVEVRLIHAKDPGPNRREDFCRENSPAPKTSGCPTRVTRSLAKQGRKKPSGRRDFCSDPVVSSVFEHQIKF